MRLDLSEIARTLGDRYHYDINEPAVVDDTVICTEPIHGGIDFTNTGRLLIAKGNFETSVQLECSRCLATFSVPVSSPIDEQFEIQRVEGLVDEDEPSDPALEEEQKSFFVDNVLDLTELLRQSLILALPIRPLCREACKGICPTCGQNRNEVQCDCDTKEGSEPFAKLAEMWKTRQQDGDEQKET